MLKDVNINNGLKIHYEYKPSVFYKNSKGENSNSKLSFNMKTLNTITVTDSTTGVSSRDTYDYADGAYYYDAQDLYGREYA